MTANDRQQDRIGPVWIYLVGLVLFFTRFGYGFATGDQDEILPYLYHVLEASFFSNDWFVQTQATGFSVRTYFVMALAPICSVLPVKSVVLALYVVLWAAIANGAYRLGRELGASSTASAAAAVLSLGLLHKWTLGSNDMVYSMLVPEMAAWVLALPALRLWIKGRRTWAALLLGVAAWFQVLVGILIFGLLVVERLWATRRVQDRTGEWKAVLNGVAWFVLASLPVAIPIARQQFGSSDIQADPSIFYILAQFRNPGHHMLLSFPVKSVVRFALMVGIGAAALWRLDKMGRIRSAGFLWRTGLVTLLACVMMFVFTEIVPVLLVAKLQLYKLTVLLKLLLLIVIASAAVNLLPTQLSRLSDGLLEPGIRRWLTALAVTLLLAVGWIADSAFVEDRLVSKTHASSDLGRMEQWISDHTERDAVFVVPPSNSTFRSNAHRSIVVNYMAFPYDDANMVDWYDRLQAIAPVGLLESGLNARLRLDEAFEQQSGRDWEQLARRYGFEFVLRRGDLVGLEVVRKVGGWTLMRIK